MKRPEGFDERPEPAAPEAGASAARQRRAPRPSRRAVPSTPDDGLEARVDPAPSAADAETDSVQGASPRARAEALAGTAGRRLGAGLSSVAGRLRAYAPDEDHAPGRGASSPGTDTASHQDGARRPDGGADEHDDRDDHEHGSDAGAHATEARVTDVHEAPIGARVRAAETAREARIAKRRRRLLERAEVRRFTRRSRHRRAAWITAAGIVVVLGASILVAVYSPLMALQTIEVKGTNRVDDAALRRALSGQLGTPLARLDFDEVKRDIAQFPLVESYVTEEAPPHTLVVTVTERTPVVAVRSGRVFDLVDPAGIVVQSAKARPATMPLADIGSAKLGSRVFRTMTEVVLALPSTVRSQTKAVAASTADDVTLTLQDGSKVVWGSPDSSDAKARLLAALVKDHEARNPGTVVEYDVSAPDNGVVRAAG